MAERDEASAKGLLDALRTALATTLALAAVFLAAAFALSLNPATISVALALYAVAAAVLAWAVYLAGQIAAGYADLAKKASTAQTARQAEAEARVLVSAKCPPDRAAACLSRPAPC